ncbi:carbon-nitrogen hydrolase family protein [Amycolatopsis acidicola]|uniref:Carbon-nitrogen hydrolase family protein n=1 Tax=Amycolatopsis acidicola TaxID=2596893 RepID=A0A5N0UXK0_9PSEU|nr:carbon-nitrogen hydrolase family protein [Amycolatopsis acidicola]KAA9157770.1 carbon-nitrogen hydrolase family protein [Amycolatopsis acidicola]
MTRALDVAVVQAGECTEDLLANLARLTALVREAASPAAPDLVVLPELITTPYFCTGNEIDRTPWAQPVPGDTTGVFAALARELGTTIAFGMYERTASACHNAVVVAGPGGEIVPWRTADGLPVPAYRKLSVPACRLGDVDIDEKYWFAPGQAPVVIELFGTRIGCVICYDRSFPEYWAVARAMGAEVVLAVVSSLGPREELFTAELRTRALESQSWVIAANRAGVEELNGTKAGYFGLSAVIRPDGEVVAQAPAHQPGVILRTTIDLDEVSAVRTAFPLGRDRRADVLGLLARLSSGVVVS